MSCSVWKWIYLGKCSYKMVDGIMKHIDILAIGIHPDDVELSCSGTLLTHKEKGYSFGICDLTQGELGTRGNAELRIQESKNALQILGGTFRVNLKMLDGFAEITQENILKISKVIRTCKPKIILANAISDRHPDHAKGADLVRKACFFSGLRKIELKDNEGNLLDVHRPQAVYHYIQDYHIEPDLVVDISKHIETKIKAIQAFGSQFYSKESREPTTPIATEDFFEFIKSRAKVMGRPIGAAYGEGFTSDRYLGVVDLFDLK